MKTSRLIFIFTAINLICTFIFIGKLPDSVIFGLTGNFYASLYVSKWYNLIIPIAQVICVGIIFLVDIFHRDQVHKYRYLTAWVAVAFTTWLMWTLMLLQYNNSTVGTPLNWPWTFIILSPIALFLFAEGVDEMNRTQDEFSIFGFSFIKDSPLLWKRTMRIAGVTSMISGAVILVVSFLNEILWHTNWIYLVAVLVWVFVYFLFTLLYAYAQHTAR